MNLSCSLILFQEKIVNGDVKEKSNKDKLPFAKQKMQKIRPSEVVFSAER